MTEFERQVASALEHGYYDYVQWARDHGFPTLREEEWRAQRVAAAITAASMNGDTGSAARRLAALTALGAPQA